VSELLYSDTITALATAVGSGGIAVIRLSGPDTLFIIKKLSRKNDFIPRYASYAAIYDIDSKEPIDNLIITFFKAPHSYTGEDLAEISAHGSPVIIQQILQQLYKLGARQARPGEFTRRAVFNNKMDLNQAEAVLDLIQAKTKRYQQNALHLFEGQLSSAIKDIHTTLHRLTVTLEYELDFNEDEISPLTKDEITQQLQKAIYSLLQLFHSYKYGKILRDGLSIAIVGSPNVGKSTLLNRILQEDRAIVSDVPGTTRDYIIGEFQYKGLPFRIIDTAGLRDTEDPLEHIGQKFTYKHIDNADIILFLTDARTANPDNEIFSHIKDIKNKKIILVQNKKDLLTTSLAHGDNSTFPSLLVSLKEDPNIDTLLESLYQHAIPQSQNTYPFYITREWQYQNIGHALDHLQNAFTLCNENFSADIIAYECRSALDYLSDLIGKYHTEDTLDSIFQQFCVGK
jgi:tRNA modification GTPase